MKVLFLLLLFAPVSLAQTKCDGEFLQPLAMESDLVVIAAVVEVDSKAHMFGDFLFVQRVKYHVRTVLKGKLKKRNIDVGHHVMTKNHPTLEPGQRRLSNAFFMKGNEFILFLAPDPGILRERKKNKDNGAYLAFNPSCSVLEADVQNTALVKRLMAKRAMRQQSRIRKLSKANLLQLTSLVHYEGWTKISEC